MSTAHTKQFHHPKVALALFLGSFVITAGQPVHGQDQAIPIIQMQSVQLATAIENLGRQAGLNYILDPKLAGPTLGPDGKYVPPTSVTFRWENLTAKEALTRLLGEHELRAIESPVSSVTRIAFTNQPTRIADGTWVASGTNATIPLIQMEDAPLDRALTQLAEKAQLTLVLNPRLSSPSFVPGKPPTPKPTVSMRWQNLTARQAIAALCENFDLTITRDTKSGATHISPGIGW